jgi:hypothetical protein
MTHGEFYIIIIEYIYREVMSLITHSDITMKKIAAVENVVDMLTKPIHFLKFKHCLDLTCVCIL